MKKCLLFITAVLCASLSFAQSKIIIGVIPFRNESETGYYRSNTAQQITSIQDAVTDVFLSSKRFSLVEREKMDKISSEKNLQKREDFIDGSVIEQSKSIGAQYIVLGNVSKSEIRQTQSYAPIVGSVITDNAEIAFNIKVVDVTTGVIMASNSFSSTGKGKKAFENALRDVKPDIEKFIQDNFKLTLSIATVEEKDNNGNAKKVLISGGTAVGMKEQNELKVYQSTDLVVDGKKMTRKVTIGKLKVVKVEDENFSVCEVLEGGSDIAKKMSDGGKIKCELINAPVEN